MANTKLKDQTVDDIDSRILIGVIADLETTVGFLLAGVGEAFDTKSRNFMLVTDDTLLSEVEHFFFSLYGRKNIGVILISSDVLKSLSHLKSRFNKTIPIILEVPSRNSIVKIFEMKERGPKLKT